MNHKTQLLHFWAFSSEKLEHSYKSLYAKVYSTLTPGSHELEATDKGSNCGSATPWNPAQQQGMHYHATIKADFQITLHEKSQFQKVTYRMTPYV